MFQDAGVAGRNDVTDDRNGAFLATKWTPSDAVKITTDYIHTDLHGIPDFGVPYYRPGATGSSSQQFTSTAGGPFPLYGSNRDEFYGFVNRDFFHVQQDIGTFNTEIHVTPDLVVSEKIRDSQSLNNYIGTLAETAIPTTPLSSSTFTANPQSRYQTTDVLASQSEATYKFDTGAFKHTLTGGVEVSQETSSIDKYNGLTSELVTGTHLHGRRFAESGERLQSAIYRYSVHRHADADGHADQYPDRYDQHLCARHGQLPRPRHSQWRRPLRRLQNQHLRLGHPQPGRLHLRQASGGIRPAEFQRRHHRQAAAVCQRLRGLATSSDPVGSEFDGTSTAYGGSGPVVAGNPNQIFGPEKNKAYEVGTKWELFNRHLLLTGALFETTKDNAREAFNVSATTPAVAGCSVPAGTVGNISCIIAGSAYYVRGIDLEAAGKITDKWSVFGGIVLMQSAVTKSNVPAANMPQPLLYTTDVGLPLANVAHQSFSLLSKYQLTDMWEFGGQAVFRSKVYGGTLLAANEGTSIPSYWRFDAFAEAKIDKNWRLKLYVNNIFNKLYYDALYQSSAPFVLEAPGRAAYLVLSARY